MKGYEGMNSLIILPDEVGDGAVATLVGSRARYAVDTHEVQEGQSLKVGVMDGARGEGRVLSVSPEKVTIELNLTASALEPLAVSLIVGVSRPQTVKKVIQSAVMFGVSSLHFVKSEKGEKSYLQSRSLDQDQIEEESLKAMEQVWDSRRPEIGVHRALSYFLKDKLSSVEDATGRPGGGEILKLIAHPGAAALTPADAPRVVDARTIIAIGPERGWSDREVQLFEEAGFTTIGLGDRVVRVELALVFLLGQLAVLRASDPRAW
jgi:RsmE family RNA methyltransferase